MGSQEEGRSSRAGKFAEGCASKGSSYTRRPQTAFGGDEAALGGEAGGFGVRSIGAGCGLFN